MLIVCFAAFWWNCINATIERTSWERFARGCHYNNLCFVWMKIFLAYSSFSDGWWTMFAYNEKINIVYSCLMSKNFAQQLFSNLIVCTFREFGFFCLPCNFSYQHECFTCLPDYPWHLELQNWSNFIHVSLFCECFPD